MAQMTREMKLEAFGEGPWVHEPDRLEWRAHGLPCLIVRSPTGAWCGYAAVPPGHPAYEKQWDELDVDIHGGLSYADHCSDRVCHVPLLGEADDVWWLGFDAAHGFDMLPSLNKLMSKLFVESDYRPKYRDVAFMKKEVERLAEQLAQMAGG